MADGPRDRLIRATRWHAVGRVAAGLLGLGIPAVAFPALGPERYALTVLTAAAAFCLSLVEFGARATCIRAVAEERVRGDLAAARRVLAAGTCLHLGAGAVVGGVLLLLADPLFDAVVGVPSLRDEGVGLLRWMVPVLVLGNAAGGWSAVLVALQETRHLGAGMVLGYAVQLGVTVALLRAGWGAPALGAGAAAGLAGTAAWQAAAAARAWPGISLAPWRADAAAFARLLRPGLWLQAVRAGDVAVFQLDALWVTAALGPSVGGAYRLAAEFAFRVRDVPLLVTAGILPAAAELRARPDGPDLLRRLYLKSTRYTVAAAALATAVMAAGAPAVLLAYGGRVPTTEEAAVLSILAVGYLANIAVGAGFQVGLALDHARPLAWSALLSAAVAVPAALGALALGLGAPGAAAATALGLLAGPVVYLPLLHRDLGLRTGEALRRAYFPALLPAAAAAAATALLHAGPLRGWIASGRPGALAALAAEALPVAAVFVLALRLCGGLDADDLAAVSRALGRRPGGAR